MVQKNADMMLRVGGEGIRGRLNPRSLLGGDGKGSVADQSVADQSVIVLVRGWEGLRGRISFPSFPCFPS